jgi:hypothetical protein
MSKRLIKRLFLVALPFLAFGVWYGISEFNRKAKDLRQVPADFSAQANDLYTEFVSHNNASMHKYREKVIQVTGEVSEVNTDSKRASVVLTSGTGTISFALDSLASIQASSIKTGTNICLKGICVGLDSDPSATSDEGSLLGDDAPELILNRAVLCN